jgi:hypothetical protein
MYTIIQHRNAAGDGHFDQYALKSIVRRGGAGWRRTNYIEHATKLADYADELWNEQSLNKNPGRINRDGSQVNAGDPKKVETRTCHNCKKKGHIRRDCESERKASEVKKEKSDRESFVLSANHNEDVEDEEFREEESVNAVWPSTIVWILDSGCGRHLTLNANYFWRKHG